MPPRRKERVMGLRKIGEVARELGLSERRIREYERAGLVRPQREARTGDRLFEEYEIDQIRLIQGLIHDKGMTIEGIRLLLAYAPCWELTDCQAKEECPILEDSLVSCYQQRSSGTELPCPIDCERCPIYHMKDQPRPAIVRLPFQLIAECLA